MKWKRAYELPSGKCADHDVVIVQIPEGKLHRSSCRVHLRFYFEGAHQGAGPGQCQSKSSTRKKSSRPLPGVAVSRELNWVFMRTPLVKIQMLFCRVDDLREYL